MCESVVSRVVIALTFQMIQLSPNNFQRAGLRVLFDVSFFIIVTTIALSIVFGIIVDTFSELRDERVYTCD